MYCINCGKRIPEGAECCPNCGAECRETRAVDYARAPAKSISLTCRDCGGKMELEDDGQTFVCPFCGSKNVMLDSDAVKIEKIRKDIELARLNREKDAERMTRENEQKRADQSAAKKFREGMASKFLVAFFIVCVICMLAVFRGGAVVSGSIGAMQCALLAYTWFARMRIIKEKHAGLHYATNIAALVLIIPFLLCIGTPSFHKAQTKLVWPSSGLSARIPKPAVQYGDIIIDDNSEFYVDIDGLPSANVEDYIAQCKRRGFTVDEKKSGIAWRAYDNGGYKLDITYFSSMDSMSIRLDAPLVMNKLNWPKTQLGALLPVPKSQVGSLDYERASAFSIYVGQTTPEQYNDYVNACMDKGFTKNYEKSDDAFNADDANGHHLNATYEGLNIMQITLYTLKQD